MTEEDPTKPNVEQSIKNDLENLERWSEQLTP